MVLLTMVPRNRRVEQWHSVHHPVHQSPWSSRLVLILPFNSAFCSDRSQFARTHVVKLSCFRFHPAGVFVFIFSSFRFSFSISGSGSVRFSISLSCYVRVRSRFFFYEFRFSFYFFFAFVCVFEGEHTGVMLRALDTDGMDEAPEDG